MKSILWMVLFLLPIAVSFAQGSFQKSLDAFLESPVIRVAPDGNSCYVANLSKQSGTKKIHVYNIDDQGNVLWHQEHLSMLPNLELLSMEALSDGVLLLLSAYVSEKQSNGYLVKLDLNGTVVWGRETGLKNLTRLFDFQVDNEDAIWLSGLHLPANATDTAYYFLSKTDKNGIPVQSAKNAFRYFPNLGFETCKYTDLTWNHSNNTLVYIEDFDCPYAGSYIIAFSRARFALGFCDKDFHFDEKFANCHIEKLENAGASLIFSGWSIDGNGKKIKPVIAMLDPTGKNVEVIKSTPYVYQPIHSQNGDIVFYAPQDKLLLKFDAGLSLIWSVNLDNCTITTSFGAEIGPDGMIYSIRNIGAKTIIAKTLPDGTLPACISYKRVLPPLPGPEIEKWVSYTPSGYPGVLVRDTVQSFSFVAVNSITNDFCVKLDASFGLPDTVCLGLAAIPAGVDTVSGVDHTWDLGNGNTEVLVPEITFPIPGLYQIWHTVETPVCLDTASRYIHVIPPPSIPFQDTLVCGPASLSLNLADDAATRYYLDSIVVSPLVQINQSGTYAIRLENSACSIEKSIVVKIVAFPPPINPLDSSYCHGSPVSVSLNNDFDAVFWDDIPMQDSFVITDGATHHYRARYVPDTACIAEGEFQVPRKKCNGANDLLYIPNVFSPNADGLNDLFQVFPKAGAEITGMKIFDRWGNLCYRFDGASPAWDGNYDGQKAAAGVYTCQIEYLDLSDLSLRIVSGEVSLIR